MQKTQIIGNLTKDANVKEVNGRKAINFSIAVNQRYKNKEGQNVESTMFYNCTIWREAQQSSKVSLSLLKGKKVYVEGVLKPALYVSSSSNQTEIDMRLRVDYLELLSPKTDAEKESDAEQGSITSNPNIDDDGLPF